MGVVGEFADETAEIRALAEAAHDSQWEQEWWQHHAADYWRSAMNGCPDLRDYLTALTPTVVLDLLDRLDAAEAESANLQQDYDRRGERLWRLAALAGHEPHESDNDATAELVVADALSGFSTPPGHPTSPEAAS